GTRRQRQMCIRDRTCRTIPPERSMEKLFIVLTLLTAMAMAVLVFPDGAISVLDGAVIAFFPLHY
ncbi:MAG: hypothetical protein QUS14_09390, partial [Pyrinomonadaceae bacterium]|nr:hypothetical protein [Pyrinomonadaceae bacterium]